MWRSILGTTGGNCGSQWDLLMSHTWKLIKGWLSLSFNLTAFYSLEQTSFPGTPPCKDLFTPPSLRLACIPRPWSHCSRCLWRLSAPIYCYGQWQRCKCFLRLAVSQHLKLVTCLTKLADILKASNICVHRERRLRAPTRISSGTTGNEKEDIRV